MGDTVKVLAVQLSKTHLCCAKCSRSSFNSQ